MYTVLRTLKYVVSAKVSLSTYLMKLSGTVFDAIIALGRPVISRIKINQLQYITEVRPNLYESI